jgi:hypothetical protein
LYTLVPPAGVNTQDPELYVNCNTWPKLLPR